MTQHEWDSGTPYCTRCGIQKGWHAEECLATANVVGFMHHLAKRRWEREGKIIVGVVARLGSPESDADPRNPNVRPPEGANPCFTALPATEGGVVAGQEKIIVEAFPPPESA